jgi:hypothetical protein
VFLSDTQKNGAQKRTKKDNEPHALLYQLRDSKKKKNELK